MKINSPEFYEAYRNRVIEVESVSYPQPGATGLGPIDRWRAAIIADHNYDTEVLGFGVGGTFAVRTRSGLVATIGTIDDKPAILHRRPDGTRELSILKTNF